MIRLGCLELEWGISRARVLEKGFFVRKTDNLEDVDIVYKPILPNK